MATKGRSKRGGSKVGKKPRRRAENARVSANATEDGLPGKNVEMTVEHQAISDESVRDETIPAPAEACDAEAGRGNPDIHAREVGAQPSSATAQASPPSRRFDVPYVPRSLYWPRR
jgi:hypothetical protein